MVWFKRFCLILVFVCVSGWACADETSFRCQGQIIQPEMSESRVKDLCGEPIEEVTTVQHGRNYSAEINKLLYDDYGFDTWVIIDGGVVKSVTGKKRI